MVTPNLQDLDRRVTILETTSKIEIQNFNDKLDDVDEKVTSICRGVNKLTETMASRPKECMDAVDTKLDKMNEDVNSRIKFWIGVPSGVMVFLGVVVAILEYLHKINL